jgi:hypothetical protein
MRWASFYALLIFILAGCNGTKNDQLISIDEVPKQLLEVAREKLPDVDFDQAVKKGNGVLEVRGKDKKGKVRDIEFSASGEVVEIE